MALPPKDKTWQIQQTACSGSATNGHNARQVLLAIKNHLSGALNGAWAVAGSSDASTAGMDGIDRWENVNDIVLGTSTRSWLVLQQTAISASFQWCIDCDDITATLQDISMIVSSGAGFTGGATNARPTAPDETVIMTGATSPNWLDSPVNTRYYNVISWISTDGECTRIAIMSNDACVAFGMFDKPKNPIEAWDPKAVFGWRGSDAASTENCTFGRYNDNDSYTSFRHNAVGNWFFFLGSTGFISSAIGESRMGAKRHDITEEKQFSPMTLISDGAGLEGIWGSLHDIYWGSSSQTSGRFFTNSGSLNAEWVTVGNFVLPWTGSLGQYLYRTR